MGLSFSADNVKRPKVYWRMPFIRLFLYGFVTGECAVMLLLRRRVTEAWIASTKLSILPNMPPHDMLDDMSGYYLADGLVFLGLVIITWIWLFLYGKSKVVFDAYNVL